MNIFSKFAHKVKLFSSENGPLRTRKVKRPAGMSGRQWKKARKAARRNFKAPGAQA